MLTPAAKRRRAEAASATLSRPFRSPAVRGKPTGRHPETTESAESPKSPEREYKRPRHASLSTKPPPAPLSLGSLVDQFTAELDTGDKTIEEAQEAQKKKTQKTDIYDEMPALIAKWREAGRLATEQVYAFVAQRIAGAGGIKAWRAMAAPPPADDDRGCCKRRDEEEEGEEEFTCEREQAEERREEEAEKEDEKSQNFTMAMMLASLNVEPGLLGYDEVEERWTD